MVAFAKLQELDDRVAHHVPGPAGGQRPCWSPRLVFAVARRATETGVWMVLLLVLALLFGVLLVLPIGGADMPVVISFLNAFTGLAAASSGFVLDNSALIIGGTLVGRLGHPAHDPDGPGDEPLARERPLLGVRAGADRGGRGRCGTDGQTVREVSPDDLAVMLAYARQVMVVPGYGLAVAQAQHAVRELADLLEGQGVQVKYAIHPVAGRMPGHMNVLLAEADVPYPQLLDMEDANPEFPRTDVALVIGANDVTNPGGAHEPREPALRHADPRRRPGRERRRPQAQHGRRLRRSRQRALLQPEVRDALRRREGLAREADRRDEDALSATPGWTVPRRFRAAFGFAR